MVGVAYGVIWRPEYSYRVDTIFIVSLSHTPNSSKTMQKREFTSLKDRRLVTRGNKILDDLFRTSVHSIRQFTKTEADAKGCYRFLQNPNVSEADILANMV